MYIRHATEMQLTVILRNIIIKICNERVAQIVSRYAYVMLRFEKHTNKLKGLKRINKRIYIVCNKTSYCHSRSIRLCFHDTLFHQLRLRVIFCIKRNKVTPICLLARETVVYKRVCTLFCIIFRIKFIIQAYS